jgi:peptidoglycan/LPS O-acetylase OafA/YrhL
MKYRAEIDGLRALAIVPVVLFHGGFTLFSGGFVGVDIFFVISGYLITTILIGEIEAGQFNLVNFYERRARRILPALFFVMVACIPFARLWMAPDQMKDFAQSFVAVVLFASNILFWRESNYFETTSDEKPLLHTWSLAVEEQYYLAFPLFLFFAWRLGRNWVFWSIVVMAAASMLLSEWGWRNAPTANFYLAPTRAWELFGGSIAAFLIRGWGVQSRELPAWLGFFLIAGSVFIYDRNTPFPSLYAIAPVAGTALIVLYGSSETTVGRLLGSRWLVRIGLVSYSAYLWHQPIFAFARIHSVNPPGKVSIIGLIILSFALAYVSWRYVESPFRNKRKIDRAAVFKLSAVGCATFLLLGIGGILLTPKYQNYWLRSQPENVAKAYQLLAVAKDGQTKTVDLKRQGPSVGSPCRFLVRALGETTVARLQECTERYGSGVLVLGDSHAGDTFSAILTRFEDDFIVAVAKGDCLPDGRKHGCAFDAVETFLKQHPGTFKKVIFVSAAFPLLVDSAGREGTRAIFEHVGSDEPLTGIRPDKDRIASFVAYLDRIAETVPVMWFAPRAAPHIAKRRVLAVGCAGSFGYRPHQLDAVSNLTRQIKAQVEAAGNPNLSVISQNDIYAFDLDEDFMNCDDAFWSDGDHFSSAGRARFGARLPVDFLD